MCHSTNTAAKRLRMRQDEHFRSLFESHFSVRSKSPARVRIHSVCSLWFSSSASCCSCFDYFVVIEIAFMDNQAQITETISRLEHRRTGNFLPGGAVNHLPKKFSQVARIFTKRTVEKKRGSYDATT